MSITLKSHYDRVVRVDDATGAVVELPICVRRFTKEQLVEFRVGLRRVRNRTADRYLSRKPEGDEQEKDTITIGGTTVPVFRVPDDEIRRRRLLEMSSEDRNRFEELDAEDERVIADFCAKAIAAHVWVKPGIKLMFEDAHGVQRQLSTGADLVEAFSGQATIQREIVEAIEEENSLSPEEKKRSRMRSASTSSSPASVPIVNGAAPDAIAAPVDAKASAASAPA
jgi:hypothetical protein